MAFESLKLDNFLLLHILILYCIIHADGLGTSLNLVGQREALGIGISLSQFSVEGSQF